MLQVCSDCRTSYHWEFPRFGCACGRYDPSLAALAESLIQDRSVASSVHDRPAATGARHDATRPSPRDPRNRVLPGPRTAPPAPKPRSARRQDRFDLDDEVDDLPWQHRSRDFK